MDGLYHVNLDSNIFNSLHVQIVGTKKALIKKKSFSLWHRCLGHSSQERTNRSVKDNILPFLILQILRSMRCIRGKLTKLNKKGFTHIKKLLEIIHVDIYDLQNQPFMEIDIYNF